MESPTPAPEQTPTPAHSPTAPRSTLLNALVRKEARSLLQYIGESFPWAAFERRAALDDVLHMVHHESNQLAQLVRYCVKHKLGNPSLGAYPQSFMGINFASFEFLLPHLIQDHTKRIAELEWSLLSAPTDAQGMIRDLIGAKRKHLDKMKALASPSAPPPPEPPAGDH